MREQDQSTREQFPAHLERREVVLDLTDEQKVDLKFFGTKIFERMRFEKPTVYIERIVRHQYVKKDVVDATCSGYRCSPYTAIDCRRLQVRLQRDRRHRRDEVRLSHVDLSRTRFLRPEWLASESLDQQ